VKKSREEGIVYIPTWKHYRTMGFALEVLDTESWLEWKRNNPGIYTPQPSAAPSTSIARNPPSIDPESLTISRVVSLQEDQSSQSSCIEVEEEAPVKLEELEASSWEPMTSYGFDDTIGTETGEDEDYHFLMSLLPHLKEIPKNRKLFVRQKLQQVIIDEMKLLSI